MVDPPVVLCGPWTVDHWSASLLRSLLVVVGVAEEVEEELVQLADQWHTDQRLTDQRGHWR